MNLTNKTINEFLDLVDSNKPTPGGGSCSALMSVISLSLTRMVGHLTTNKKVFLNLEQNIQNQFKSHLDSLLNLKKNLLPLIDEDSKSFNEIMNAYRLPRETTSQKQYRSQKINEATVHAIKIPYEIAKLSLKATNYIPFILKYGNKQTISDIGVGSLALTSGIEGALYNVLINLIGFKDEVLVADYKEKVASMLKATNDFRQQIQTTIYKELELH